MRRRPRLALAALLLACATFEWWLFRVFPPPGDQLHAAIATVLTTPDPRPARSPDGSITIIEDGGWGQSACCEGFYEGGRIGLLFVFLAGGVPLACVAAALSAWTRRTHGRCPSVVAQIGFALQLSNLMWTSALLALMALAVVTIGVFVIRDDGPVLLFLVLSVFASARALPCWHALRPPDRSRLDFGLGAHLYSS